MDASLRKLSLSVDFGIDVFDDAGRRYVSVASDGFGPWTFEDDGTLLRDLTVGPGVKKACYDMRPFVGTAIRGPWHVQVGVIDLALVSNEHGGLHRLVESTFGDSDPSGYLAIRRRVIPHVRACRTAGVDLSRYSMRRSIDDDLFMEFLGSRASAVWSLFKRIGCGRMEQMHPSAFSLYEMEGGTVRIDRDADVTDRSSGSTRWRAHATAKSPNAPLRFVPWRSKTGRVQTGPGSLDVMQVPRTDVRRMIVPSHDGGLIASFDLNAADYRCIVNHVGDPELSGFYAGCDDFHDRTCEVVFGDCGFMDLRRPAVKGATYAGMYGGGIKSVARMSGLSEERAASLLRRMSFILDPIAKFRGRLHAESRERGYVTTPRGLRIPLDGSEHPGKVLALFGQTCTNDLFMDMLVDVHDMLRPHRSRVLFPVHDELVVDVHPDEPWVVGRIKQVMQSASDGLFLGPGAVGASVGPNYWDMEDWDEGVQVEPGEPREAGQHEGDAEGGGGQGRVQAAQGGPAGPE